jgi:hypothetical protein
VQTDGELPAAWRFILAFAIVVGIVGFGLVLVYSWFLLAPLLALGLLILVGVRWMMRQ